MLIESRAQANRKQRGGALAGAIAIITICLLATFVVATAATFNLQVQQRTENLQIASLLAHSAIQQAIVEVGNNPNWSQGLVVPGRDSTANATVTFDSSLGVPFSTNNQDTKSPRGWKQSLLLDQGYVPAQRIHLVAVGTSNNVCRTVEAVLYMPNFTTAIASSGPILLENSVVGSVVNCSDAEHLKAHPQLLKPGDLSTSDGSSSAVTLVNGSLVSGNLQSCGVVSVSTDSRVQGEIRSPWSPTPVPDFDLTQYDPAQKDANGQLILNFQNITSSVVGAQNATGLVRAEKNLIVNGDLKVDNCLFFVPGNLTVIGGVLGTGAIVVQGNAIVTGGAALSSDDSVALLAGGNLSLVSDSKSYEFQGLLYTKGDFYADHFTIVGSFIADGGVGTGKVHLKDSQLLQSPTNAKIDIFAAREVAIQIAGDNDSMNHTLPANNDSLVYGNFPNDGKFLPNGNFPEQATDVPTVPWITPALAAAHINGIYHIAPFQNDMTPGPWYWYDVVTLQIQKEDNQFVYYLSYKSAVTVKPNNGKHSPERYTSQAAVVNRLTALAQQMSPWYSSGKDVTHPPPSVHRTHFEDLITNWEQQIPDFTQIQSNFSIDPNKFLKQQQKIRIAALREY